MYVINHLLIEKEREEINLRIADDGAFFASERWVAGEGERDSLDQGDPGILFRGLALSRVYFGTEPVLTCFEGRPYVFPMHYHVPPSASCTSSSLRYPLGGID